MTQTTIGRGRMTICGVAFAVCVNAGILADYTMGQDDASKEVIQEKPSQEAGAEKITPVGQDGTAWGEAAWQAVSDAAGAVIAAAKADYPRFNDFRDSNGDPLKLLFGTTDNQQGQRGWLASPGSTVIPASLVAKVTEAMNSAQDSNDPISAFDVIEAIEAKAALNATMNMMDTNAKKAALNAAVTAKMDAALDTLDAAVDATVDATRDARAAREAEYDAAKAAVLNVAPDAMEAMMNAANATPDQKVAAKAAVKAAVKARMDARAAKAAAELDAMEAKDERAMTAAARARTEAFRATGAAEVALNTSLDAAFSGLEGKAALGAALNKAMETMDGKTAKAALDAAMKTMDTEMASAASVAATTAIIGKAVTDARAAVMARLKASSEDALDAMNAKIAMNAMSAMDEKAAKAVNTAKAALNAMTVINAMDAKATATPEHAEAANATLEMALNAIDGKAAKEALEVMYAMDAKAAKSAIKLAVKEKVGAAKEAIAEAAKAALDAMSVMERRPVKD